MKHVRVFAVLVNIALVGAIYLPIKPSSVQHAMRRQDADNFEDEIDQDASTPYQNQNDGANNGDGYGENEPDGPYEETPREEENQADLERFFDDHLGASDRDGMDNENLPSNLVPKFTNSIGFKNVDTPASSIHPLPSNQKLKIARPTLDTGETKVVALENDDLDKVYVTNQTDKPFEIDALGGYNPEEDFQSASMDIEGQRMADIKHGGDGREPAQATKDIVFNEPDANVSFNDDADETEAEDPNREDPNQIDFDAEMRQEARNKHRRYEPVLEESNNRDRDGDSEGGWVNDGVDDMDIPSQLEQDIAIRKGTGNEDDLAGKNTKDNE